MESAQKECRFDIYCQDCKYFDRREDEDPCWDCLDQGWNWNSRKPINFKEANQDGKD